MYVYGGYILTAGKLDNGNPWKGINVLLGEIRSADDYPLKGDAYKARRDDELLKKLMALPVGCPVDVYFDHNTRIVYIAPHTDDHSPLYVDSGKDSGKGV